MRTELNALRQIFSDCIIQMVVMPTEVWGKASPRIIINDFESLLQDKTRNEWLTEEAIAAIMRTDTAFADALMINLNVWTAYISGEQWEEDLLILLIFLSIFVIILYYFNNHWIIAIIKVTQRDSFFLIFKSMLPIIFRFILSLKYLWSKLNSLVKIKV